MRSQRRAACDETKPESHESALSKIFHESVGLGHNSVLPVKLGTTLPVFVFDGSVPI